MNLLTAFLVILTAKCTAYPSELVQLIGVRVPSQQVVRSNVLLECLFELHSPAALYSVKWYKDGSEFYRYLPGETPPVQAFSLPGINVNVSHSDEHRVILTSVLMVSSGLYLCEVSTEAPFFHTVTGQGTLTVIASAPAGGPRIWGLRGLYLEGDMVEANCTSSPSKPATSVTWYANDKQVTTEWLVDYGIISQTNSKLKPNEISQLDINTVGLRIPATRFTFPNRILKLRCVTQLGSQLWEQQRWTFLVRQHKYASESEERSKADEECVICTMLLLVGVLLSSIPY